MLQLAGKLDTEGDFRMRVDGAFRALTFGLAVRQ